MTELLKPAKQDDESRIESTPDGVDSEVTQLEKSNSAVAPAGQSAIDGNDEQSEATKKALAVSESAFNDEDEPVDKESADNLTIATGFEAPKRTGLFILMVVFGVFGLWSLLAPIDGAALAPGKVAVKSHKKTVQHLEGGIVQEIRVRSGDAVNEGDVLLIMDDTQSVGQLEIIKAKFLALKARESRLLAERDGLLQVAYGQALVVDDARAQSEMASQDQIFLARKNAREGGMEVLQQRVEQLQTKVTGLTTLKSTKQELVLSYQEEVADFTDLLKEGFADKNRLRELQRNYARLKGEVAELISTISGTEIQIGETRLQILQEDREFLTAVVDELGEIQTELYDVKERLGVLADTVSRTLVKAPVAGVVHGLQVHTKGAVISPGTAIAEIIPQSEELVVEAQVSTTDVDRVKTGQLAKIRFSAFNSAVPTIEGVLLSVSADSLIDEVTGMPYYSARVGVTKTGLKELRDLTLVPGMPAEVYITTGSRTLFQYMMQPIANSMARSLIED